MGFLPVILMGVYNCILPCVCCWCQKHLVSKCVVAYIVEPVRSILELHATCWLLVQMQPSVDTLGIALYVVL